MTDRVRSALLGTDTDLIGVSLDGSSAETHDVLRSTRGNFRRVLKLLDQCREVGKPTIVRTLVTAQNLEEVARIGSILKDYDNIIRWSLLEFTSIGEGYKNSGIYQIPTYSFRQACENAKRRFQGSADVDIFSGPQKAGAYALLTPAGDLYGTSEPNDGRYPTVGNILTTHLAELADRLPIDPHLHKRRYGAGIVETKQES